MLNWLQWTFLRREPQFRRSLCRCWLQWMLRHHIPPLLSSADYCERFQRQLLITVNVSPVNAERRKPEACRCFRLCPFTNYSEPKAYYSECFGLSFNIATPWYWLQWTLKTTPYLCSQICINLYFGMKDIFLPDMQDLCIKSQILHVWSKYG